MNPLGLLDNWLVRTGLGGGLLLLLAWAAMQVYRQPARRQRLGEAAIACGILLAGLACLPAWLTISYPVPAEPRATPASSEPVPLANENTIPPSADMNILVAAALPPDHPVEEAGPEQTLPQTLLPAPTEVQSSAGEVAAPGWSVSWDEIFVGLQMAYAAGVAWLAGRWLIGCLALTRLLRSSIAAPEEAALTFAALAEGMSPKPRLLVSRRLQLPIGCGLFRPTVIVPAGWCENKKFAALRWVFAHELTHLQRRDVWSCWLFTLAQLLYFYLPWFWLLRRQVRLSQEYIADAAAVAETMQPADYAEFLLRLTPAPAVATVTALGVLDNSSDLFRRVTMLLNSPARVDRGCPGWWSVGVVSCLAALAALLAGIGLRADAMSPPAAAAPTTPVEADVPAVDLPFEVSDLKDRAIHGDRVPTGVAAEPDKKEEKKEEPKKEPNPLGVDIDKILKQAIDSLPPGQEFDKVREQLKKQMEQLKNLQQQVPPGLLPPNAPLPPNFGKDLEKRMEELRKRLEQRGGAFEGRLGRGEGRLGASVAEPDEVLVEQLNLTKGQGLVVGQVKGDSPAAKAGIQPKDILLEIDGKPVPSNVSDFVKIVHELKANTAVDAVVLRKGKKETIKGISLPEVKRGPPLGNLPLNLPFNRERAAGGIQLHLGGAPGQVVATARNGDQFTSTCNDGDKTITITGTVVGDKSKVNEITIQDGEKTNKYDDIGKVPEALREKVKYVIESAEKTNRAIADKKSSTGRRGEQ
jgi:beta-lactamase regulating signal transducer with metallopeptidase domain